MNQSQTPPEFIEILNNYGLFETDVSDIYIRPIDKYHYTYFVDLSKYNDSGRVQFKGYLDATTQIDLTVKIENAESFQSIIKIINS